MKVLLTGASGYIGGAFASYLLHKGCQVGNIGFRGSCAEGIASYNVADDSEMILDDFNPDVIVHFAAEFDSNNVDNLIECNIKFPTELLLANSRTCQANFISIGSYWQLGDANFPDIPIDLYSASKKAFEAFLEYIATYKNVSCAEVLFYGVFGEADHRGKIIDLMIDAAVKNKELSLTFCEQRINLVHVDDVCQSLWKLVNKELAGGLKRYSVHSNREYILKELVELVTDITGHKFVLGSRPYRDVELMTPRYDSENLLQKECHTLEQYIECALCDSYFSSV